VFFPDQNAGIHEKRLTRLSR